MTPIKESTVGRIYLLPFFIFFTVSSIALLQPEFDGRSQHDSSLVNQITLSFAYAIALILLVKQHGLLPWVLSKSIPMLSLLVLMMTSLFWSEFPNKVIISVIHNIGLMLISLCMVALLIDNKEKFFRLLLMALFIYITATIAVTLLRPGIGLMTSHNIYDASLIGRWRGLTTHPNSLGTICLFTAWVALSSFFHTQRTLWFSLIAILTLLGDFYCLYKSNSMTSTLLSLALIVGMLWFAFIGKSSGGLKFFKVGLGLFLVLVGVTLIYILHPEVFSEKFFFRAIGRDASLSGRASLWELGLKGFAAKPYLGWSYDSLRSFLKHYDLGYGTLHNGYLDLLVRGGLISIFLFTAVVFQIFWALLKQASKYNRDYVFILALVVAALMHNMTEASLLTNTNIIWFMVLLAYFYCVSIDRVQDQPTPNRVLPEPGPI